MVNFSRAQNPCSTLIFAHGAGAPMDSPFMEDMTQYLLHLGVNVVRFEFPYMAQRRQDGVRRPPNRMNVLQDHWREVYRQVCEQTDGPVVMAGKSMGGRVASMLADELQASALICFGYPFIRQESPNDRVLARAADSNFDYPRERDALGNRSTVESYSLSSMIEFEWLAMADHDLKPLQRSGYTHAQYLQRAAARAVNFIKRNQVGGQ